MPTTKRVYAPNRIRELRLWRGLGQEELAARAGGEIIATTISKLEKSQMGLTLDYMLAISKALGVPPDALITGGAGKARMLPVVGKIAAGNWREAVEAPQGWIAVPEDVGGADAFILLPQGDSMNEIVEEGGFIVVDPEQIDLIDGKSYAIENGSGDATFKRYRPGPPPMLEPVSTNKEHRPIPIGREPFRVIGRVTFAGYKT